MSGGRRRLDTLDRLQLLVYEHDRKQGRPHGYQSQYWFGGAVDREALGRGLERAVEACPEVTARLSRRPWGPSWVFTGAAPALAVERMDEADDEEVLRFGESLVARGIELEREPPVRFTLVDRGERGDVLIIEGSHVLAGAGGPDRIVEQIVRSSGGAPSDRAGNPLREYLRQHGRCARLRAGEEYVRRFFLRRDRGSGRSIRPTEELHRVGEGAARCLVRSLDGTETATLLARLRDTLGFENVYPALVASAFRATITASRREWEDDAVGRTSVPVEVGNHPRIRVFSLTNLVAHLPVGATLAELRDRDGATAAIAGRMRGTLRRGRDLGEMQFAQWLGRPWVWPVVRVAGLALSRGRSKGHRAFTCSYRGPVGEGLGELVGASLERSYQLGYPLTPTSLSACLCAGRLHLALRYVDDVIPTALARAMIDFMAADLGSKAALPLEAAV